MSQITEALRRQFVLAEEAHEYEMWTCGYCGEGLIFQRHRVWPNQSFYSVDRAQEMRDHLSFDCHP